MTSLAYSVAAAHAQVDKLGNLVRDNIAPPVPSTAATLPLDIKFLGSQIDDYAFTQQRVAHPLLLLKALSLQNTSPEAAEYVAEARRAAAAAVDASGLVNPVAKSMWSGKRLRVPPLEFDEDDDEDDDNAEEEQVLPAGGHTMDINDGAVGRALPDSAPQQQQWPQQRQLNEGGTQVTIHGVTRDHHTATVVVKGWAPWFELALPDTFPLHALPMLETTLTGMIAKRFPTARVSVGKVTSKPRFYGLETQPGTLLPRMYRYVKITVNNVAARRSLLSSLRQRHKADQAVVVGPWRIPISLAADHMPLEAQFRADMGLVASKWFRVHQGQVRVCEWSKSRDTSEAENGGHDGFNENVQWQSKTFSSQLEVLSHTGGLTPLLNVDAAGADREIAIDIENDSSRRLFPDKYRGDSSTFISLAAQNTGLAKALGRDAATMVRVVFCVGACAPLPEAEFPHTVLLCYKTSRDMMEALGIVMAHVMDVDLVTGWYNYAHDFPFLLEEYALQFHDPYLRMTEAAVQGMQACLRQVWKAMAPQLPEAETLGGAGLQHCVGPVPSTMYLLHTLALQSTKKVARFLCCLPDLVLEAILPDLGAALPDAVLKALFNDLMSPNGADMPYVPGIRSKMAHRLKSKRDFKTVQTMDSHGPGSMSTNQTYLAGTPEVITRQLRLALEAEFGVHSSEQQAPLPKALDLAPPQVREAAWTLFLTREAQHHLSALVPDEFRYYFQGLPDIQEALGTADAAGTGSQSLVTGAASSPDAGNNASHSKPAAAAPKQRRRRFFAKKHGNGKTQGFRGNHTNAESGEQQQQHQQQQASVPNENVVQQLEVRAETVLYKHGFLEWTPELGVASGLSKTAFKHAVGGSAAIQPATTWFTARDRRGLERLLVWPQSGVDVTKEGPLGLLVGRRLTKPSYMEVKYMETGAKGDNCYLMWNMNGRVKHDMMQLVKDMRKPEKNSLEFALTSICKLPGKVELPYARLFDLTERGRPEDLAEIAVYADRDATGPLDVMNHLKLPIILLEQSRTANTELDDICNGGQQVRSINLLTKYTHEKGIALNTGLSQWKANEIALDKAFKVNKNTVPVAYEGATVIDPIPGYYQDPIECLDFASLYPSIILSAGLCPSVLLTEDEAKAILKFAAEAPPDYDWSQGGTVDTSRMRPVVYVPGKGWRVKCGNASTKDGTRPFCEHVPITQHVITDVDEAGNVKERETQSNFYWAHYLYNVVEDILSGILRQRKIAKGAMEDAADDFGYDSTEYGIQNGRQLGLKMIANSLYGFFGADTNPFGCKELAASVTYFGRNIIEATQRMVTRLWGDQARTLYGDTDSVMVNYGGVQLDTVAQLWHGTRKAKYPDETVEDLKATLKRWMEGAPTPQHSKLILTWIAAYVTEYIMNHEFQEMGLYKIEIELEKAYYPYILFKKKNYAGLKTEGIVYEDPIYHPDDMDKPKKKRKIIGWSLRDQPIYPTPKIDTKGIAAVRRDKTPLVRETSKSILHELLVNRSIPGAFQRLVEVLRRFVVQPGVPETLEDGRPCEGLGVDDFKTTKTTRSSYDMSKALPASAYVRQRRINRSDHGVPPVGARIEFVVLDRPAESFDVYVAKYGNQLAAWAAGEADDASELQAAPWPQTWEKPSTKYARTKTEKDAAKRAIGECAEDPEYVKRYGLPVDKQYYLLTVERAIKKLLQPMPQDLPLLDTAFDLTEHLIVKQQQALQPLPPQQLDGKNENENVATQDGCQQWSERGLARWAAAQLGKNPVFRDMRKRVFFDTSGKDMNQTAGTERNVTQLLQYFRDHRVYCNLFGSATIIHPELRPVVTATSVVGGARKQKQRSGLSFAAARAARLQTAKSSSMHRGDRDSMGDGKRQRLAFFQPRRSE